MAAFLSRLRRVQKPRLYLFAGGPVSANGPRHSGRALFERDDWFGDGRVSGIAGCAREPL